MATKQVNIDIIAKDKTTKAMNSATKGVNKLKNNVQQSVATQQKSFNALGNTVRNVIGGVIVFQALRFSKQMVDMASSVQEMQSKSSVVFGRFVNDVRGQLQQFGDEVGRSTFELEGMASSIQDTFVPMGFARGEASKLSVQLTKLAVDVASFNNASDTETMMAFQSALVGNHETVRRFGVVITEATLKQELLRMGITKNSKEVTNAEKVQARLNLIIAGTSDAHGDATKTSGSFANESKALSSALQELSVGITEQLLPSLSKTTNFFTRTVNSIKDFLIFFGKIAPDISTQEKRVEHLDILYERLADKQSAFGAELLGVGAKSINSLKMQIGFLENYNETLAISTDAVHLASLAQAEKNKKEKEGLKIAEEKAKLEKILAGNKFSDASMGGFKHSEPTFSSEEKLAGAMAMVDLELEIEKEAFKNKFNVIMEQDELLAEQRRIVADETLKLAKETADKQMEIQKKLFNDNFNLIKSGKAGEINLQKMSGQEMNEMAKDTGRLALAEMAKHNKTAFELNKAFAIKDAVISTAQGVSKALGMGPIGIPLAIAIGALGFAQVATIASQQYQGRKQGGRMNQGQPYLVGEAGAELVVPDRASNVVPNGQLGGLGKAVTVNFNISTVDARGFNELLVNSRGTIVNLINSAVNEKGKMAII